MYSLRLKGERCNFENIIEKCFNLFPKDFGFKNHPQWPDSRKLDRPLRSLRKQNLISGDPQTDFSLTKKGKEIALNIAKKIKQKKLL